MSSDDARDKAEEIKGSTNEQMGESTDKEEWQSEGQSEGQSESQSEKAKGGMKQAGDKLKDTFGKKE